MQSRALSVGEVLNVTHPCFGLACIWTGSYGDRYKTFPQEHRCPMIDHVSLTITALYEITVLMQWDPRIVKNSMRQQQVKMERPYPESVSCTLQLLASTTAFRLVSTISDDICWLCWWNQAGMCKEGGRGARGSSHFPLFGCSYHFSTNTGSQLDLIAFNNSLFIPLTGIYRWTKSEF